MLWIVIIVLVLALAVARACALSTKRKGNVVKKIYSNYFRNCRKMNIPHLMMWFSKPLMEQRKSAMAYRQTRHASEDLRLAIDEDKGHTPVNLYYCKRFYSLYNQLFEKVPQVGEIFKPLHAITENRMLPR